jgi:hypothetical protein
MEMCCQILKISPFNIFISVRESTYSDALALTRIVVFLRHSLFCGSQKKIIENYLSALSFTGVPRDESIIKERASKEFPVLYTLQMCMM